MHRRDPRRTDPEIGNELVMLGAHFDSWHAGTGATDNGSGSAVMMEAIRLINGAGQARPARRRVAPSASPCGAARSRDLRGSRALRRRAFRRTASASGEPPREVKPAHDLVSPATTTSTTAPAASAGSTCRATRRVAPIFRAWLRPFHDLDASTLDPRATPAAPTTWHSTPSACPVSSSSRITVAYGTRTHHSNMDNWDHAVAGDLQQAATIIAAFAWHTAQRDEMLPRKPYVPRDRSRR